MSNFSGCCNCGEIKYQVTGKIAKVVNCHCNLCRKMNGSAFSTYAIVSESDFMLLSGKLNIHKVSENAKKYFCGICGTPIFNSNPKYPEVKILHFGTLNLSSKLMPEINIYCESEVHWIRKINELPSIKQGF
jgi:hypothetical protein